MQKKFLFSLGAIIGILFLLLTGCPLNDPNDGPVAPIGNFSGTGTSMKFGFHGYIRVTLTMVDGSITEAAIIDNADGLLEEESDGLGKRAIEVAKDFMVKKNTVEIDTISGATVSSNAIRLAGREALAQITGE